MKLEGLIQQNSKMHILIEWEKIRKCCKEFLEEIGKFQVNETHFDWVFQASKTQHEGKLINWTHLLKNERKQILNG